MNNEEVKSKKTLNDHIYRVGSARNASECVTNTKFILNHIELTFEEGLDIATAIRNGEEYDFDSIKPALQTSSVNKDQDVASKILYDTEMEQFKLEFKIKYEKYNGRINQYRRNKTSAAALLSKQCSSGMIVSIQSHLNPEPRASRVVCSTTTRFLQRNLANLQLDFQGYESISKIAIELQSKLMITGTSGAKGKDQELGTSRGPPVD